jgi:hypothetical protein
MVREQEDALFTSGWCRINSLLHDLCEVEAKNLRFFASTSHKSCNKEFILYLEDFEMTHSYEMTLIYRTILVLDFEKTHWLLTSKRRKVVSLSSRTNS